MKFKISFTLSIVALAALLVVACSTDESISPSGEVSTETDEQGYLKNIVPAEGGTVNITFSTNCDWKALCYDSDFHVTIMPESGRAGENTIAVTLPENTSTEWDRSCDINIVSTDGTYIFDVSIIQDKKALLQLSQKEIDFKQQSSMKSITITSNKKFEVIVDEDSKSWLKAEIDGNQSEGNVSTLKISVTTNESLDSRQGTITIKLGNVEEQISVVQKGGVIFDTELLLDDKILNKGSNTQYDFWYTVPPKQSTFTLKIKSNINWDCTLPNADWIAFNNTEFNSKDDELTFSLAQQTSGVLEDRTVEFAFKCDNGDIKTLGFEQRGWGVTIYVHNGEKLSEKYEEIEDGYIVTSLYITGGTLDDRAYRNVQSVTISGVETVPNYFCYYCKNLLRLSLGDGITKIGTSAFEGCSKIISSISIPKTVTYIGDRAFLCYRSYPRVTCYNPMPPTLGSDVFHNGTGMGILSVPLGSKPRYKVNSSWSKQFDQIEEF